MLRYGQFILQWFLTSILRDIAKLAALHDAVFKLLGSVTWYYRVFLVYGAAI